MIVTRSTKKYKVKTPGGRTVVHLKTKKPGYARCKNCGAKLNRFKLTVKAIKKLSKTEKRPARPFPELCSRCMRKYFKEKVR
jgi:large subunit ribosomal protein L34e